MQASRNNTIYIGSAAAASLIFAGLKLSLLPVYTGGSRLANLFLSFSKNQISDLILLAGVLFLSRQAERISDRLDRRYRISASVLGAFFGLMIPVGRFFRNGSDSSILFSNGVQILKAVILVLGHALLFYILICSAFFFLKTAHLCCFSDDTDDAIQQFILKHSALLFLILFIITSGVFVLFYPGFLMGDTASEIYEACGLDAYYFYGTVHYLYPDSTLTNMHPIAVTFYIKGCLEIGKQLFGSYNSGLGLAAVGQFSLLLFALTRSCRVLAGIGIKGKYILVYLLYIYANILVFNYMYVITKDVLYLAFFFLFIIEVFLVVTDRASKAEPFLLAASALGAAAFRGEGFYAVTLLLAAASVYILRHHGKGRKKAGFFGAVLLGLVTVHLVWAGAVLPMLHVTPGLKSFQALIPMQQTARYVVNAEDRLTDEEKETLSAVIDLEEMKKVYNPTDADAVKNIFHHNCSDEELQGFLQVWRKICLDSPKTAFMAWLNNKYEYFYAEDTFMRLYSISWSQQMMDDINMRTADTGRSLELHYPGSPKLAEIRSRTEAAAFAFSQLPILNLLMLPAGFVLALLIITVFFLAEKCAVGNVLLWPLHFIFIVTNLFSGANASYGRYLYPIIVMLPFVLFAGMEQRTEIKKETRT